MSGFQKLEISAGSNNGINYAKFGSNLKLPKQTTFKRERVKKIFLQQFYWMVCVQKCF